MNGPMIFLLFGLFICVLGVIMRGVAQTMFFGSVQEAFVNGGTVAAVLGVVIMLVMGIFMFSTSKK